MFEIKVTWDEDTKIPSIYQFKTSEEAKAFQQGLTETRDKIIDCPQINKIEKGRWGAKTVIFPRKQSPWLPLIFSVFVGAWAGLWWHLLNQDTPVDISEHLLMGAITTLGCYLTLLLYGWVKN
jgi:hypothetical protein